MTINGAHAGAFSPISVSGVLVRDIVESSGLTIAAWTLFFASYGINLLLSVLTVIGYAVLARMRNLEFTATGSSDDFDLRDLRKRPMSIYVGVNPDDLHRLRPLLALFFQQAIGLQTLQLPEHNPELRYQVLMLLDEFAALGRIPIIAEAVAFLPGYNVRVVVASA